MPQTSRSAPATAPPTSRPERTRPLPPRAQFGDNNLAGNVQNSVIDALAGIVQVGTGNTAANTQQNGSSQVAALIAQTGEGNTAANVQGAETVTLEVFGVPVSKANASATLSAAAIVQSGDRNVATNVQGGSLEATSNPIVKINTPAPVAGSVAGIAQIGDDNNAATFQLATVGALAGTVQIGDLNTAVTTQSLAAGVTAATVQNGDGNTAVTTQAKGTALSAAATIQNGNGNVATTTQIASIGNASLTIQDGNSNLASVNQSNTAGNQSLILQSAEHSLALVDQSGAGGTAPQSLRPEPTPTPGFPAERVRLQLGRPPVWQGSSDAERNYADRQPAGSGQNSLVIQAGRRTSPSSPRINRPSGATREAQRPNSKEIGHGLFRMIFVLTFGVSRLGIHSDGSRRFDERQDD